MEGDRKGGFSIFWADDGLDTGPILLQRECYIGENDTVDSVYNGFMYPVGKPIFKESFYNSSRIGTWVFMRKNQSEGSQDMCLSAKTTMRVW